MKQCAFTGHRPKSLPWKYNENSEKYITFKERLENLIQELINKSYSHFIVGMAEGFDTLVCEVLIDKRSQGYNVFIEGAIPCLGQESKWSEYSKKRYNNLVSQLDKKTVLKPYYTSTCMQERNDYMLKNSELLVACYANGYGGTLSTIKKAQRLGKDLIIINPETLEITENLSMI